LGKQPNIVDKTRNSTCFCRCFFVKFGR